MCMHACMCKAGKISPLMRWGVGMTCSLACLRIVTEALVLSCHCVLLVYLDEWEASVHARDGSSRQEKQMMMLSPETLLGIKITGRTLPLNML